MHILMMTMVLAGMLLPEPARRQKSFSVRGNVAVEEGRSNRPVAVFLEPLSARPVVETQADAAGNFSFQNVLPGFYYVRVKHAGFREVAQQIEVPAFNRPVTVVLQRAGGPRPTNEIDEEDLTLDGDFEIRIRQPGIPEEAVREYEKALDDDRSGKTARAIQGFRRALGIAPNFIEAAGRLGAAAYRAGRFDDAEKILVRTIRAVPSAANLRLLLANVFVKQRKYDRALLEIDAFLEENPNAPERQSVENTRSKLIQAINE